MHRAGPVPALLLLLAACAESSGPSRPLLREVSLQLTSSCGLVPGGTLRCWGQLPSPWGVGVASEPTGLPSMAPQLVAVELGFSDGCGIDADGLAWCWGDNSFGQLGNGSTDQSDTPMLVAGGVRFTQFLRWFDRACGLDRKGGLWCWGHALHAPLHASLADPEPCERLVLGELVESPCVREPRQVDAPSAYVSLTEQGDGGCGLTPSGGLECWGWVYGLHEEYLPTPTAIALPATFESVSPRGNGWVGTCAVATDGGVWCWGASPVAPTRRDTPAGVRFREVSVGGTHACAVAEDGDAWCWGLNPRGGLGILGNGSTTDAAEPVKVLGGLRFTSVSAGSNATCAVAEDGAHCWGLNSVGQLGDGTTQDHPFPTRVSRQD